MPVETYAQSEAQGYCNLIPVMAGFEPDRTSLVLKRWDPAKAANFFEIVHAAENRELRPFGPVTEKKQPQLAADYHLLLQPPETISAADALRIASSATRMFHRFHEEARTWLVPVETYHFLSALQREAFLTYEKIFRGMHSAQVDTVQTAHSQAFDTEKLTRRAEVHNSVINKSLSQFLSRPTSEHAFQLNRLAKSMETFSHTFSHRGLLGKARVMLDFSAKYLTVPEEDQEREAIADSAQDLPQTDLLEKRLPHITLAEKSPQTGRRFEAHAAKLAAQHLTCFNRMLYNADGTHRTEIDIETTRAIIELTLRSEGKLQQILDRVQSRRINPWRKTVIFYAPHYDANCRDVMQMKEAGVYVVHDDDAFKGVLKHLHPNHPLQPT